MKIPIDGTDFVLHVDEDDGLLSIAYAEQDLDDAVLTVLVKERSLTVEMHDTMDSGEKLLQSATYKMYSLRTADRWVKQ